MSEVLKEKYAAKIVGLLRKAESTTPEEAELLLAKAQELMTKYAIEQAMLDEVLGQNDDPIEQIELVYTGIMREALGAVGWAVIRANECKGVCREWGSHTDESGRVWKQCYFITVTGFRRDLDRVRMLDASLQLQAATSSTAWWKASPLSASGRLSKLQTHRERRNFIRGFAHAVERRLTEAATRAEAEVVAEKVAAEESANEAGVSESVALVLRNRRDRVQDWYDQHYGNTLRSSYKRGEQSSSSSVQAGREAGSRADIGQKGMSGRKSLKDGS